MNLEVERRVQEAMTVRHLREALDGLDEDAAVFFVCDYGDYHHTPQALQVSEVEGDYDTTDLVETAYSQSGLQLREERGDDEPVGMDADEDEDDIFPVVILRS